MYALISNKIGKPFRTVDKLFKQCFLNIRLTYDFKLFILTERKYSCYWKVKNNLMVNGAYEWHVIHRKISPTWPNLTMCFATNTSFQEL